jgi:hypothetical protein
MPWTGTFSGEIGSTAAMCFPGNVRLESLTYDESIVFESTPTSD